MPVLVDPVREYPNAGLAISHWCHMAVDGGFEELHAFAAALGMPRQRFQGDHYDLPPWVRERAVTQGALEVSTPWIFSSVREQLLLAWRTRMRFLGLDDDSIGKLSAAMPSLPDVSSGFALRVDFEQAGLWSGVKCRVAISAVIEEADGTKSYWALAHPPGKPDFHHADGFALQLPPPTPGK